MNTSTYLSLEEKQTLLRLARCSIERAVHHLPALTLSFVDYSPVLQSPGASFVTLTTGGVLRGCIGTLDAHYPLVQDVCEHAASAAMDDYRFKPVQPEEVAHLSIEISCLSPLVELIYENPCDLPKLLRPGVDGVVLINGSIRSTFLPQVWEKLPDPIEFLSHLAHKMGGPPDLWKHKKLKVFTYEVDEFHE
jgi:uncharacterized protein